MLQALPKRILLALSFATAVTLTGCSTSFTPALSPAVQAGTVLKGSVHGGQAPVTGASVYLFATSTTGYNSPNTSLLKIGAPGVTADGNGIGYVTTGAGGNFTITGDYTCAAPTDLLYIVAVGGNPGLSGVVTNPAIAELAAIGPCSKLSTSSSTPFITINELTTVAAVTALAPFSNALVNSISTSSTNISGLSNAFVTAGNLVNTATGAANATTPSSLGTIPVAELNTLADVLAACVNTNGIGGPCATLFTATTVGSSVPTNVAQAMYNIARNPALKVATIYGLVTGTPPFTPTLTTAPSDWSVAVVYSSPLISSPNYLAIDSQNNIWTVSGSTRSVVQLSNAGAITITSAAPPTDNQISANNYNQVLAIDLNDSVWIDNNSYGVSVVNKAGKLVTAGITNWGYEPGPGTNDNFSTDYVSGFGGIAIDGSGNALIGSSVSNNGVVKASSTGYGLANYTGGGLSGSTFVAVDATGNIWAASHGNASGAVVKFSSTGAVLSGASGFATQKGAIALAFDHAGDAFVANQTANTISALANDGTVLPTSPFYGGGISGPSDIAVDGDGNIWVSNFSNSGVSEFSPVTGNPLSPVSGFYNGVGGNTESGAVAIDSAGSVWTSNWGSSNVSELVGIGAPTVNPIALAAKNNTLGTRP